MAAGTCAGGTCSCVNGLNGTATCSATLKNEGGFAGCAVVGSNVFVQTDQAGCFSFSQLSSTTYYELFAPSLNATCNPTTGGTPIKNAPAWSQTDQFCSGQAVGKGCPAGQVCAPTAANHCVLETGNQAACTVTGYSVMNTTAFYSGYDDSGRSCACSCDLSGSCSGIGFNTGGCAPFYAVAPGCGKNWSPYDHAQISPPSGVACTPGATMSGSTSTTGFERTVCCTQ
jgi:hypothetical protein